MVLKIFGLVIIRFFNSNLVKLAIFTTIFTFILFYQKSGRLFNRREAVLPVLKELPVQLDLMAALPVVMGQVSAD
jgi:hypothetical protein